MTTLSTMSAFGGVALLVALAWSVRRIVRALHMLQLDGYSNTRFCRWLSGSVSGRLVAADVAALLAALLGVLVVLGPWDERGIISTAVMIAWALGGTLLLVRQRPPTTKKPLVYTGRAARILAVAMALAAAMGVIAALAAATASARRPAVAAAIILVTSMVLTQLAPMIVLVANVLLTPVQQAINAWYVFAARRRLRECRPVVVGITGSYGKTTTKYVLTTILAARFDVLMTPHSYNTLLGVTRAINEQLEPRHQLFVVEMGAYRPGDIRELAELVRPNIGILTAIGPQHLERFATIERIEATKYELIQALPDNGVAVFNADDPRCARLADQTVGPRVLRYGLAAGARGLRIRAERLSAGPNGSTFTVVTSDGDEVDVQTRLLGRHNVSNILAAVCVALEVGMRLPEIAAAIPKLEPAPHRLQLIAGAGGITVIDDSYNSNVVGAMEALEVLRSFTTGQRVLVTPGMVELGELQMFYNQRFGVRASQVCDFVVLIGSRQTAPIAEGLGQARFPTEKLRVVNTLPEATAVLRTILRPGDVVLFENDLPDLYLDDQG